MIISRQLLEAPTINKALFDLLIIDIIELITDVELNYNLGNCYRRIITFIVNHTKSRHKGKIRTLHFESVNFAKLRSILYLIKWKDILESRNTDKKLECFNNILDRINHCMGNKSKRTKVKPGCPVLLCVFMLKFKQLFFKKHKAVGTLSAFQHYKESNRKRLKRSGQRE